MASLVAFGLIWARPQAERERLVADYQRAEKLRTDGRYDEAAGMYKSITVTAERLFGPESPDTADLLNNQGAVLEKLGRYAEAKSLYQRCVRIAEARFPGDPRLARFLTNLGIVSRFTGQFGEAEQLLCRALSLQEKLGSGHEVEVAATLHHLAEYYQEKGALDTAEQDYRKCLKIRQEKLGPDDPAVADTLDLMGQLYSQLGQDSRALDLFRQSLKIRQDRLGPDHLDTGASLNDLGTHYLNHRQFAEAEPLFRQSLKILEKRLGPDHPDTARRCQNLAWVCLNLNQVEEAKVLQARAVRVWTDHFPPDDPTLAEAVSNQAVLDFVTGQSAQAEALQRRALKMRQRSLGPDHPKVADSLGRLAGVLAASGHWDEAAKAFEQDLRILRRHTDRVLPTLSESEQLAFLQQEYAEELHAALSLAWHGREDAQLAELSASWVLNGKGVAQEVLAARTLLVRNSADPDALESLTQLRAVRSQMAALAAWSDSDPSRKQREQLGAREADLVKALGRTTGHSLEAESWVELDRVRKALAQDTVLIEIARFPVWDLHARTAERVWGEERYAAWVIPAWGRGSVRLLDLGSAREVEATVWRVRTGLQDRVLNLLAKQVLRPLEKEVGEARRWILSADGALWLVPWAALPLADGRYAVEKLCLSYVVSGRDLVRTRPDVPHRSQEPVILAAPDYNLRPDTARAALHQTLPEAKQRSTASAGDPISLADVPPVAELPNTLTEAQQIAPRLERYAGQKPRMYVHEMAREGVVKSLRGPQVLVLSTHGFFLDDRASPNDGEAGSRHRPRVNPLLRCGLLLAGCNSRRQAPSGAEDGILTGLEIVDCDLRGCKLVVLSACETGVGEVHNGEGVAGLRQAFLLAGAETVVATLWQVPDRETALLMVQFFDNLAAGQAKAEALRNAQLWMLHEGFRQTGSRPVLSNVDEQTSTGQRRQRLPPQFWAAFTITGVSQ